MGTKDGTRKCHTSCFIIIGHNIYYIWRKINEISVRQLSALIANHERVKFLMKQKFEFHTGM